MILVILLLAGGLLSGCQWLGQNHPPLQMDENAREKSMITIATGGTTGPYFAIGNGMAQILDEQLMQIRTSVRSTGGGVENIDLLTSHQVELGFIMADIASFAYEGRKDVIPVKDSGRDLRTITALYPNYVHVITLDPSLKEIKDLRGKRVGVGDVGSGTEVNARTILQAHDITYRNIDPHHLSYKESVAELRNGSIDAAFLTSGLPNPAIESLLETHQVYFIPIPEEKVREIAQSFPFYSSDAIPEGTYENQNDVATAAITNLLLTRADLPEELIYEITKAIFDHLSQLQDAHEAAHDIDLSRSQQGVTVPFHPGARKYFEEHNIELKPLQQINMK